VIRNSSGRIMDPHLEKNPEAVKAFMAANQPPHPSDVLREFEPDDAASAALLLIKAMWIDKARIISEAE
jgi:hypothetical protein